MWSSLYSQKPWRRHLQGMFVLVAMAWLSACSYLPQSGPDLRRAETNAAELDFAFVPLTAGTVGDFARKPAPDLPNDRMIRPGERRLSIGPGDRLRVQFFEASADGGLFTGAQGQGGFEGVLVDDRGFITLPYIGRMKAAGETAASLQRRMVARLERIAVEPAAFVQVIQDQSNSITVTGAVRTPGRYSLSQGIAGALDALALAGAVDPQPWHYDVLLRRGDFVARQSLADVLNGGDFVLEPGDQLVVERRAKSFYALGAIARPGPFEFPEASPSLLTALAIASGLSDAQADRRGVYVFRPAQNGPSRGTLFQLDMSLADAIFVADAFAVQPGDVVYVQNALATDFNKLLLPILRSLSLIQNLQNLGDQ